MDEKKPIGKDATGYNLLTKAVAELLNQFPGLDGREIYFEKLADDSGTAFFSDSGALVMTETRSITDHVVQSCQFPFFVAYRTASTEEYQKIQIQAFLDSLGKWICKEPVEIDGVVHRLYEYPRLSDGRKITRITRDNSYGAIPQENGVQDWLMPVTVRYTNEFDMW